jgi:UDP-2,4-diacetamido-2,4,6-trideoxy-beta-L-altropyranose hydrolase
MHLIIRADGGPEIGFGHLVRTSALASELLRQGHSVTYAATTPESVTDVCPAGVETVELPARTDVSPFRELIKEGADVVLIDSYLADEDYQHAVRDLVPLAVVSDDTRHPICADLVINGNLGAKNLDYEVLGDEPAWCLGPDYLLLRESITELASREPPWREEPERALVSMGGSDIADLTPTVIRAFDGFDLSVEAIVGPGFSERQERDVRAVATDISTDVQGTRYPDDLAERMFRADFAVSTASSTTYELLALGTPIVSRPVADNQEPIAAALRERDVATVLERGRGEVAFQDAIQEYMSDAALRRDRRERGRALVDGKGVLRVHTEVLSLVDENLET